jgi:Sec-independent protein translocase protein TatA
MPTMETIEPGELLGIMPAIGLLSGADRLPQTAGSLGEGIREVRSTLHETSQPDDLQATHEHSTGHPPGR